MWVKRKATVPWGRSGIGVVRQFVSQHQCVGHYLVKWQSLASCMSGGKCLVAPRQLCLDYRALV